MEQYSEEMPTLHETQQNGLPPQKWKSSSTAATTSENSNGCFDCNICLENALDPVVTLCGHLYCWPCIYKWLQFQNPSAPPEQQQQCPVCKASISHTTVVPLFGRGRSTMQTQGKGQRPTPDLIIPRRPPVCGVHTTCPSQHLRRNSYQSQSQSQSRSHQHQQHNPTALHPMVRMFGEMVYTRVFGNNAETSLCWYPNSYQHMGSISPRMRRQEMKAEKSLNRVSIFLFCFFVFCLLLF